MLIAHACEKEVSNPKLPEFRQKLAVTAFISPSDTVSYFYVSSNKKIYGELDTDMPLGKMNGYLSDGINEVELDTIQNGFKIDHKKMPVNYGQSYKLRISTSTGLNAEATCTVPGYRKFDFKVDTFSVFMQSPGPIIYNFRSMEFKVTITDIADEDNFYRISGRFVVYYSNPGTRTIFRSVSDPCFEEEFFTDKGMDGQEITLSTNMHAGAGYSSRDSACLELALFNTERSYYLYHRSLENYHDGDNPFMEMTPVFSNIDGGLGIFTSYAIDSLKYSTK